ncbi:MAG: hypothetical protein KDA37_02755, partial [Planctomycetales bacterium]|nr:hypothetical protein [Planctomycetales bacterium]
PPDRIRLTGSPRVLISRFYLSGLETAKSLIRNESGVNCRDAVNTAQLNQLGPIAAGFVASRCGRKSL